MNHVISKLKTTPDEVEAELLKALYKYEEILSEKNNKKTRASRTWQMINRYGLISAVERVVNKKADAQGYKVLVERGFKALTFEAVISKYPEAFSKEVVEQANKRLKE